MDTLMVVLVKLGLVFLVTAAMALFILKILIAKDNQHEHE